MCLEYLQNLWRAVPVTPVLTAVKTHSWLKNTAQLNAWNKKVFSSHHKGKKRLFNFFFPSRMFLFPRNFFLYVGKWFGVQGKLTSSIGSDFKKHSESFK